MGDFGGESSFSADIDKAIENSRRYLPYQQDERLREMQVKQFTKILENLKK
jgi:hypothetical protein